MASRQPRRLVQNICSKPSTYSKPPTPSNSNSVACRLTVPRLTGPGQGGQADSSAGTGISGAGGTTAYRWDHGRGRSRTLLAVLLTAFLTCFAALRALTVNVDIASDMMTPQVCEGAGSKVDHEASQCFYLSSY